mmetsp:Transcript_22191/g.24656  ORF Transcript_22191/g.24656 Transcript_22191/m.24656 type:complete len:139 (+) Transcript_22191:27-443(+)|eukprot:CAMPEP_0205819100 /NCGR_PEP_ID=MMETSP0206-20130828/1310_1 /ASSEMBLY_ACC=CAM_ASM_000279 /TAXON_ID=36767 /ORGANISM="Euplotes focardii, Strain TN1" /LENGTH=138 /DNA_ID=CAMNT_0053112235 /DNA_START=26 /DNA_END=442 /DNA_ORIENTATION=+
MSQSYLEQPVRQGIVDALQALYKEQPANPFEFLSKYFAGLKKKGKPAAAQKVGGVRRRSHERMETAVATADVADEKKVLAHFQEPLGGQLRPLKASDLADNPKAIASTYTSPAHKQKHTNKNPKNKGAQQSKRVNQPR